MTLVKLNNRPASKSFNNFFEDFFHEMPSILPADATFNRGASVPVNIKETKDAFEVELVAPGFEKGDFKISLENNLLTIAAEHKAEEKAESDKMVRREYRYRSFSRSFNVDENIDAEKIDAKYVNGVLALNLPKKPEVKAATKQINIQ
jgi:HSP20 family protein